MVSPRWRKVLRDLWSNKTRTALVVLSIAVGVFAVGMIVGSQLILSGSLSVTYLETHPAHATLYGQFDEDAVLAARRVPGVADAEGRGDMVLRVQDGPDEWRNLRLTTIWDWNDVRINQVRALSGAWPPEEQTLLLERAALAALGVEEGAKLVLEQADGRLRTLRVAGIVHDLGKPSATFDPTLNGYITSATQEWLGGGERMDEIHLLVEGIPTDEEAIRPIADAVKDKLEKGGYGVGWSGVPPPGKHWAADVITSLMTILGVLGFLATILSGFLVVNTISALLTQQLRQIGVMKTIGARQGQLVQMYLGLVTLFGVLSLLVAVPLGAWAAHAFVNFTANMLNFYEIPFQIPPLALALEIGVGLLVPLAAALWPVLGGTRISVREAISSNGMGRGQFGESWLDRLLLFNPGGTSGTGAATPRASWLQHFAPPRPLLLSLRNTFRRKGRLLLTLSTLVLGGAIFIAVLTVYASLLATLDEALAYWKYDVTVTFSRPYRIEQLVAAAERVPGVVAAESWSGAGGRRQRPDGTESDDIFILGPPAETEMIQPKLLAGRWLLPEDENALVINSVVLDAAADADIGVGDSIEFKINDRESTWQVVGIVQGLLSGPIAYANYPYLAHELRFVGRGDQLQLITTQHDGDFQQQVATALQEHFERQGMNVTSTDTTAALRENIIGQFNILVGFLAIMALLIAVVGALGLTGTMSINVLERSREIGVMRAIGASDGAVLRIFLVEGIIIGVISWALGAVLSIPVSQLLCNAVGVAFLDAPLLYTFSTSGALGWLGVMIALASLSSWWPSWRASRLTVRDVLAYE